VLEKAPQPVSELKPERAIKLVPELLPEFVWQQIRNLLPDSNPHNKLSLCVGFSGGLDSTVLLHLLTQALKAQQSSESPTFNLKAIHINHQLQKEAGLWVEFCRNFCSNQEIPFQSINVSVSGSNQSGVEAAARNARYIAFKDNLSSEDILLTAHHRDDQIETVFLQLLRGTGIEGAAAINPCSKLNQNYLLRPLLNFDRKQLEAYATIHKLQWVEDPSNAATDYGRNYLRHNVLPVIEKRWPSYRKTIQRFSNNARSAAILLNDYVVQDFELSSNPDRNSLKIDLLLQLSLEKRLLVIRFWIKQLGSLMPSESILLEIHRVLTADEDTNPVVEWGSSKLRRYRNEIFLLPRQAKEVKKSDFFWDLKSHLNINGLGELSGQKSLGYGLNEKYAAKKIKVTFRQGGEKCQPAGRQGTHSLKKLLQEYEVPPWQRENIPILVIDGKIAAVVGLFYCDPFAVKKEEQGILVSLELD